MAEVGGTKALWRGWTGRGDVVALVEAEVVKGMQILKDDVFILVATSKGAPLASFLLGPSRTRWPFRHVLDIHPDGHRFLYAYGRTLYELDLTGAPSLARRYTIPKNHYPPYEAVYFGDGAVCSSEDRLYLLGSDWKQRQIVGAGDVGYFHLGRIGGLLIAACYDVSTTPAGPTFRPDIVAYRLMDGELIEVARGKGPGRDPFVLGGRLYVRHNRKVHEVTGLPPDVQP